MLGSPDERVWLDARRHGIVLVRPLGRALAVAGCGGIGLLGGYPVSVAGAALLAAAAAIATAAVWRWDRTHVVLTSEALVVVQGVVRRRAATVRLTRVGAVELEQSLLGRRLGYGTIVAGELEIACVPAPGELVGLVTRLSA